MNPPHNSCFGCDKGGPSIFHERVENKFTVRRTVRFVTIYYNYA